jgi:uncharacterized Zn-binding protein involved in type VI secretion
MAQPAIRLKDPGTHGGVMTTGAATVMIGGFPAARRNDVHAEPVHGPQTVLIGSPTVLIEGQQAARANDPVSCGAQLIATQMTVLIGP